MNFNDMFKRFKKDLPSEVLGRKVNPEALTYIAAGDTAFQNDNFPVAINHYTKAIELDSTNNYPFSKRGKCFQMTQAYDQALTDLFKSKDLNDNFENNQSIAECYLYKKEYLKAVQYFDYAIAHINSLHSIDAGKMMGIDYKATKARTFNNQALCYFHLQDFDKAIECTTRGIQENPNYPNNYNLRGIVLLSQGKKTEAKVDIQNAARLGDSRANAILAQYWDN